MVADTIGVNRSTARSIVARYISEGRIAERPRGGANNVRVNNEMKDCLNAIWNDNCMLPLAQINQELRIRKRKPRIHDGTVARTLDGMLFRFKIARRQPAERNRPDVIQKRHDYESIQASLWAKRKKSDCRTRHFSNCWPCFSLCNNRRDECSKVCRLLDPKRTSSTTAHQLTITQAILGPTPSLRSCPLMVHF